MDHRDDKLNEIIRQFVAEYISRESNRTSLITITRVHVSKDGRHADIFLSVLPEHRIQAACDFTNRHARDLRAELRKTHRTLRHLPHFRFLPDTGEQNRQRIDELSRES